MPKKAKGDGDEPKKKSKLPMIIVGVVLAAGAYKFVLAPKKTPPAEAAAAAHGAAGATTPTTVKEGEVLALPDLTLNLADSEPRYLRVGIALILQAGTSTESMKNEAAKASDVAVDVLSAKTYADLHKPGAKEEVKKLLSEKVREAFEGKKVARVIFTSFVMQ